MIRKVISIRHSQKSSTTEVVDPQLKKEWQQVSTFWKQIARHVNILLNQISSPNDFIKTLDSILVLAMKEPLGIKNKSVLETFYSPENTAKSTLESLANILLQTSLARHNHFVKEMPLWKMVLAMKVKLLGIRLSSPILLQILSSPQTHTTQALHEACPTSIALRTILIKKQTSTALVNDTAAWQSCISRLNQLDLCYPQILDTQKPLFQENLDQIKLKVENHHCSIGTQNDLEELHTTVIGWLPHYDWSTLAQNHTTLIAKTEAQRILTRIGIRQETEGGFNVHDILEVIRLIAQTRGFTPTPDPYVPANRDPIQLAIRQQELEFNDPLDLALLIHELYLLPGSPNTVLQTLSQLQNEPESLEISDTQTLTQLRASLCEFILTTFAHDPEALIQAIHLFPENPIDLMPTKTLCLRIAARLGLALAFQTLINDATIESPTINWLDPIPGDPDNRHFIHVALLGGSSPILNTIWDNMSQQEGPSHTTLPQLFWSQEPHSLLHHAAASKDRTSILFVIEKLTQRVPDIDHPPIDTWLQHTSSDGYTPLLRAVFCGNAEVAYLLLQIYQRHSIPSSNQLNTGIFKITNERQNILHLAVLSGRPEILRLLLNHPVFTSLSHDDKEAFILAKTSSEIDCLRMALTSGNVRLTEPLVKIILHGKSFEDKLRHFKYFFELGLNIATFIPELSTCRQLPLRLYDLENTQVNHILKLCPNLEELDVSDCQNLSEDVFVGVVLPNLKKVNAANSSIDRGCLRRLLSENSPIEALDISDCQNLIEVDFEGVYLPDLKTLVAANSKISGVDLSAILQRSPNLNNLDVSYCQNLAGGNFEGVSLPNLKTFLAYYSTVSGRCLNAILQGSLNLNSLDVSYCQNLAGGDFEGVALPNLQLLDASNCNISDVCLSVILRTCFSLVHLDISYCSDLGNSDFEGVALPNLQLLDANNSNISGVGLSVILSTSYKLQELDITSCENLADGDFKGEFLMELKIVQVNDSNICPEGLTSLLNRCPKLESLDSNINQAEGDSDYISKRPRVV